MRKALRPSGGFWNEIATVIAQVVLKAQTVERCGTEPSRLQAEVGNFLFLMSVNPNILRLLRILAEPAFLPITRKVGSPPL